MPIDLIVPEVGESITEVEIGRWLKQEGEAVAKDEPIVEIETDKVSVELPAPADGVIQKINIGDGNPANVGDVIGSFEAGAAPAASAPAPAAPAASAESNGSPTPSSAGAVESEPAAPATSSSAGDAAVMPAAQRLLDENGIAANQVTGSGPGGRILKEDVQNYLDNQSTPAQAHSSEGAVGSAGTPATPQAHSSEGAAGSSPSSPARAEETVRLTPLRRTIAKSLVSAQQTAALLTTFNEVDMTAVMALRGQYKEQFIDAHGVKLGFMSFFVKATIDALKQFPAVNAEVQGDNVVYKHYYDIGVAIGGGKGLVVPVLRNAEAMSFAEIEKAIGHFAKLAKDNALKLDDLQGGTFTITNGGVYGSLLSTPIVNPPQSGVLGMHGIIRRPIAVNPGTPKEAVEVRPMMYIALTYDHRIVDGREAVTFLRRIKDAIEDPTRMLLEA